MKQDRRLSLLRIRIKVTKWRYLTAFWSSHQPQNTLFLPIDSPPVGIPHQVPSIIGALRDQNNFWNNSYAKAITQAPAESGNCRPPDDEPHRTASECDAFSRPIIHCKFFDLRPGASQPYVQLAGCVAVIRSCPVRANRPKRSPKQKHNVLHMMCFFSLAVLELFIYMTLTASSAGACKTGATECQHQLSTWLVSHR